MSSQPWEIERKYRVADPIALRKKIESLGGRWVRRESQCDRYFVHPARDFQATDEALRIRTRDGGSQLTYKGPRQERWTKIREEIEVDLAAGDSQTQKLEWLLERLGFYPRAAVRKQRDLFELDFYHWPVTVCLDQVESLGTFVELELIASPEEVASAKTIIEKLESRLGLSSPLEDSYLKMLGDYAAD
jgi:adenylate cyclase class 2